MADISNACKLSKCEQALLAKLGSDVVLLSRTAVYQSCNDAYFSEQNSDLQPRCILSPRNTQEVSDILTIALPFFKPLQASDQFRYCPIAIRSGGHCFSTGSSNTENGFTIDLRHLNSITVHEDQQIVSIGPGATWGDVYSKLDPLHSSVAGARAAQVGVGGISVGGGISFFSTQHGWTCDSLIRAEVVLSDGRILIADEENNSELLIALRGGGRNFGIVTGLDFRMFKQGPVWGGQVFQSVETIEGQIKAVSAMSTESFYEGQPSGYDENAAIIMSFGFAAGRGAVIVNNMVHTDSNFLDKDGEKLKPPGAFEPFLELPRIFDTLRVAPLHEISIELGSYSPNGKRQLRLVTTHDTSEIMLNPVYQRWNTSLDSIRDVPEIKATKNSMGLEETNKSLMITLLSATWDDPEDDVKIETAAKGLFAAIEEDAHQLGAYHPFVYLNYAAPWQDPIASYGTENVERIRRVSREVDLQGAFFRMMPGGFKIPR
ncbi:oxidoreductase FAD-binding protein [Penicillium malachiteum]|nr:oxidoreductase FAD-binding protein [Penicillium malachiteum]